MWKQKGKQTFNGKYSAGIFTVYIRKRHRD